MRSKTRDLLLGFAAKNTYSKLQQAILGGELEEDVRKAVKPIYPIKSISIRKSQLLQTGVVNEKGPTLDEIHEEEARTASELKAKKAAALAEAMEEESEEAEEETTEEVAEAPAEVAEAPEPVAEEAPAAEEVVEEAPAEASTDYSSMTVAQLKELLKEAGKPVSGKKAELIERLQE